MFKGAPIKNAHNPKYGPYTYTYVNTSYQILHGNLSTCRKKKTCFTIKLRSISRPVAAAHTPRQVLAAILFRHSTRGEKNDGDLRLGGHARSLDFSTIS